MQRKALNLLLMKYLMNKDGRVLELLYAKETIKYLFDLWGHKVVLHTKTKEGRSVEIVCDNDRRVTVN